MRACMDSNVLNLILAAFRVQKILSEACRAICKKHSLFSMLKSMNVWSLFHFLALKILS